MFILNVRMLLSSSAVYIKCVLHTLVVTQRWTLVDCSVCCAIRARTKRVCFFPFFSYIERIYTRSTKYLKVIRLIFHGTTDSNSIHIHLFLDICDISFCHCGERSHLTFSFIRFWYDINYTAIAPTGIFNSIIILNYSLCIGMNIERLKRAQQ